MEKFYAEELASGLGGFRPSFAPAHVGTAHQLEAALPWGFG
ncbi:hypothetical protein MPNT_160031 [Candidatus Methylacidithermus pantelleriae]|uniref:Uncharacterized protein n=1 Tax=Candidatus Methylacidithermus pantelleriae TaxID=2744239 RepID=A0A8J2FN98_9BACT|nr:hypothetical protein MPNT_160031 [Candidatus Methylacidithermus pantelleriae]